MKNATLFHLFFLLSYELVQPVFKLYAASTLFAKLSGRFPVAMRGMNVNSFGKLLVSLRVEHMHTMKGNMYKVVPLE